MERYIANRIVDSMSEWGAQVFFSLLLVGLFIAILDTIVEGCQGEPKEPSSERRTQTHRTRGLFGENLYQERQAEREKVAEEEQEFQEEEQASEEHTGDPEKEEPHREHILAELAGMVGIGDRERWYAVKLHHTDGSEEEKRLAVGDVLHGRWRLEQFDPEQRALAVGNGRHTVFLRRRDRVPLTPAPEGASSALGR